MHWSLSRKFLKKNIVLIKKYNIFVSEDALYIKRSSAFNMVPRSYGNPGHDAYVWEKKLKKIGQICDFFRSEQMP